MYKKTVLENGVRVASSAMQDVQSAAVGVWINVGARFEEFKFGGISHFLEHLVFKGTASYSCQKIKESIEGVGGSLNGFTAEEGTCYWVKIPAAYLELALDILAEMVICPVLPPPEIIKERTVVLEEIKMYKDLPQSYVYELLDELLWPDQPLGRSILGSVESVSGIKRQDLKNYKERYYTPENIVVSAAGLLKHERFADKVRKKFRCLKKRGINNFAKAREAQSAPQIKILTKDTEQTHLAIGFQALKREHPLKYALGILHIILGANSSSRLFSEIREKRGLAYEIGTVVKRLNDTGAFIVHAGVDNKKVDYAVRLIFQELEKIKDKPVAKDEFRRAKEFLLGQLMLFLEDTLDQMFWIGESMLSLNKLYTLNQVIQEVKKVTLEDVLKVGRMVFRQEKTNIALIGPLKDKEKTILGWVKL